MNVSESEPGPQWAFQIPVYDFVTREAQIEGIWSKPWLQADKQKQTPYALEDRRP